MSEITTRFLAWCSERPSVRGKEVLVLVWDNASWHIISREVKQWLGEHNRRVKKGEDHKLLVAEAEYVTQSDRAQEVDARQTQGIPSRRSVQRPRVGRARLRGFWMPAL